MFHVAINVTYFDNVAFDCGPSRFTVWKRLRNEGVVKISEILDKICMEHGRPDEVLMDHGTSFRLSLFQAMLLKWDIKSHYRNACRPPDNGIVECIHRPIKRIGIVFFLRRKY